MRAYTGRNRESLHAAHIAVTHGSMLRGCHSERIHLTRKLLMELVPGPDATIVEIGCSLGEISGPFAENHSVFGYDINPNSIATARESYPKGTWTQGEIEGVEPKECDVLVMCEVLEHLHDPVSAVKAWLPRAKHCILSHPVNETNEQASALSSDTHEWSFTDADVANWFVLGGHECIKNERITLNHGNLGTCDTVVVVGRRA